MSTTAIQTTTVLHDTVPWVYRSFEDEYRALRQDAAVLDLTSARLLSLPSRGWRSGLDVLPRDLDALRRDGSAMTLLLDDDGAPADLITVHRLRDRWLLETSFGRGEGTFERLRELGCEEVRDAGDELAIVGVEGPYAWRVVRRLLGEDSTGVPLNGIVHRTFERVPVILSRTGFTGEYGYKLIAPAAFARPLFEAAAELAEPVGLQALETAMLEVRQPVLHREAAPGVSALECGYHWLIDITRSNFAGYSAVAAEHKAGARLTTLGALLPAGTVPAEDARVSVDGLAVGRVVWHAHSPGLDAVMALLRVESQWAASGIEYTVQGLQGPVTARTVSSPYLTPMSWSVQPS